MTRSEVPQHGFTLIEVLIATAVLAIALGAFITGGAQYADQARYIHDKTLAQWVARNQLVQYELAPQWPDTGTEDGDAEMGGQKWRWVAEIKESPDPGVRRVDVRVYRINPETDKPKADSTVLLSGFVTQHIQPKNTPAGGAEDSGDTPDNAKDAAEAVQSAVGQ